MSLHALLLCASMLATPPRSGTPELTFGSAPEPYATLSGGDFTGPEVALSPDPLVQYQWPSGKQQRNLQVFSVRPVNVTVVQGACTTSASLVHGNGTAVLHATADSAAMLRLDFGVELPAWLELDAVFPAPSSATLTLGIGEYDAPWQSGGAAHKSAVPKAYAKPPAADASAPNVTTYRLETNPELYEGVRFGFVRLTVATGAPAATLTLSAARLVVQAKARNYTGAFHAPDDELLERVWWTAAYTVRVNFLRDFFGSILIDRGDREAWTGDAHPAQAAALVAFSNFADIKANLGSSIQGSGSTFPTYQCYWVLSIIDYYSFTGDASVLLLHEAKVRELLMPLLGQRLSGGSPHLGFVGWDDRTGAGFSNSSCAECERDFSFVLLRAANESAAVWETGAGGANVTFGRELREQARALATLLRTPTRAPWHASLLLASASDSVNAGLTTPGEESALFARLFNDSITVCQLSPFNTYWTLQALGRMGRVEQALFVLRACYGGMLQLGATTFWETFATAPEVISGDAATWNGASTGMATPAFVPWTWSGITSLCHPWAAGPAFWMSQMLLGVRPLSPGFQRFEIAPMLTPSLTRLHGRVPTPHGAFAVSYDLQAHRANITVPPSAWGAPLTGRAAIPVFSVGTCAVASAADLLDGRFVLDGVTVPGSAMYMEEAGPRQPYPRVWTPPLLPGQHTIEWVPPSCGDRQRVPPVAAPPPAYPPPVYAAHFVGKDGATGGDWRTAGYGKLGWKMFGRCDHNGGGGTPSTCVLGRETQPLVLGCTPNSTISAVRYADFGEVQGDCKHGPNGNIAPGRCGTRNLTAIVSAICTGHNNCTLECSEYASLGQHGCMITPSSGMVHNVSLPDPCGPVPKQVAAQASCTGDAPPCRDASLPTFVHQVTNAYDRGTQALLNGSTSDRRALQQPAPASTSGPRAIGVLAETVIIAIDIDADAVREHTLAAYFVDWERQGRQQSVALLNATDAAFGVIAPAQLLTDFGDGVYLVWRVRGSVRIRIAHVGGDPGGDGAPLSALFWGD